MRTARKLTARRSAVSTAEQQDETIAALQQGKVAEFVWPTAQAFFTTVRTHTMEGMFADPVYGGNKDFAGWRLVGFPGAQPQLHAGGHAEQTGVHARADHRPAVAGERRAEPWQPKKPML